MCAVHRESHRRLLREFSEGRPRQIDAVVVPAGRSVERLLPAAALANDLGAALLAMCRVGRVDPSEFGAIAKEEWPDLCWFGIEVPDDLDHPFLPKTASPRFHDRDWRHGGLSTMRNLSLLLARVVGWKTLFLIDDDIKVPPQLVREASCELGPAVAVGLTVDNFPDNSVVCHANRLSGGGQDVFVGASALVLDATRPFNFFPRIYNDDWLFLYDAISEGQVARIDRAEQLSYAPFEHDDRALAEEFGEVIAEGLMAALESVPAHGPPMDLQDWQAFLHAREDFIRTARNRLDRQADGIDDARHCLDVALHRLHSISAQECVEFVRRWRADLLAWHEVVAALPSTADFQGAANHLGLTGVLAGLST